MTSSLAQEIGEASHTSLRMTGMRWRAAPLAKVIISLSAFGVENRLLGYDHLYSLFLLCYYIASVAGGMNQMYL